MHGRRPPGCTEGRWPCFLRRVPAGDPQVAGVTGCSLSSGRKFLQLFMRVFYVQLCAQRLKCVAREMLADCGGESVVLGFQAQDHPGSPAAPGVRARLRGSPVPSCAPGPWVSGAASRGLVSLVFSPRALTADHEVHPCTCAVPEISWVNLWSISQEPFVSQSGSLGKLGEFILKITLTGCSLIIRICLLSKT